MKNRIAAQWYDFAAMALPLVPAESPQRIDMRRAFYAGATALFTEITRSLTPGPDAQPADEQMLMEIDAELRAFAAAISQGRA